MGFVAGVRSVPIAGPPPPRPPRPGGGGGGGGGGGLRTRRSPPRAGGAPRGGGGPPGPPRTKWRGSGAVASEYAFDTDGNTGVGSEASRSDGPGPAARVLSVARYAPQAVTIAAAA